MQVVRNCGNRPVPVAKLQFTVTENVESVMKNTFEKQTRNLPNVNVRTNVIGRNAILIESANYKYDVRQTQIYGFVTRKRNAIHI